MTVASRIPVVVYADDTLRIPSLERIADYASRAVLMGPADALAQPRLVELGLEVSRPVGAVGSIEQAMERAGQLGVAVVVAGPPADPAFSVSRQLTGAANAAAHGLTSIAVHLLSHAQSHPGRVVVATRTGELSGWEPLFASGFAQRMRREVEVLSGGPPGAGADRLRHAEGFAQRGGVPSTERRVDDPVEELRAHHAAVSTVVVGSADTAVRLLQERPAFDVIIVFDGMRLLSGDEAGERAIAGIDEALTVATAAHAPQPTPGRGGAKGSPPDADAPRHAPLAGDDPATDILAAVIAAATAPHTRRGSP